ncbi:MAG: hypothetical protein ACRC62_20195, partial [Microcoleus sp.]
KIMNKNTNKNVLSLLGYSGCLTLMLLGANPASAGVSSSQDTDITGNNQIALNAGIDRADSQSSLPDINSDKVGEVAILTLGCGCPGCRAIVIQTIQQ